MGGGGLAPGASFRPRSAALLHRIVDIRHIHLQASHSFLTPLKGLFLPPLEEKLRKSNRSHLVSSECAPEQPPSGSPLSWCLWCTPLGFPPASLASLLRGWLLILSPWVHGNGVSRAHPCASFFVYTWPICSQGVNHHLCFMTPRCVSSPNLCSELQNICMIQWLYLSKPDSKSFVPAPLEARFPPSVLLSKRDHQPARCLTHEPGNHLDSSLSACNSPGRPTTFTFKTYLEFMHVPPSSLSWPVMIISVVQLFSSWVHGRKGLSHTI